MGKAYKKYWKNYFNFKGKTDVGDFFGAVLVNIIIIGIISIVTYLIGLLGKLNINVPVYGSLGAWGLVNVIPTLSLMFRRFRSAKVSGFNFFFIFLPLVGWIILLFKFLKPAK